MSGADIGRRSVALAAGGLETSAEPHSSAAAAEKWVSFTEIPGKAIELSSPGRRPSKHGLPGVSKDHDSIVMPLASLPYRAVVRKRAWPNLPITLIASPRHGASS